MTDSAAIRPPRIYPALLVIVAFPLLLGGFQLLLLGGSFYYLLAGLVLLACARLLSLGQPLGTTVYGLFLAFTVAWSLWEAGFDPWALAPRILPFAILGSWLLLRRCVVCSIKRLPTCNTIIEVVAGREKKTTMTEVVAGMDTCPSWAPLL